MSKVKKMWYWKKKCIYSETWAKICYSKKERAPSRKNIWNRRNKTPHCRRHRCSIKSRDTLSDVLLITLDKIYFDNFRIFDDFFITSKRVIFFKNGPGSMIFSATRNSLEWINIIFIQRVWMRHCYAKKISVLALLV